MYSSGNLDAMFLPRHDRLVFSNSNNKCRSDYLCRDKTKPWRNMLCWWDWQHYTTLFNDLKKLLYSSENQANTHLDMGKVFWEVAREKTKWPLVTHLSFFLFVDEQTHCFFFGLPEFFSSCLLMNRGRSCSLPFHSFCFLGGLGGSMEKTP